VRSDLVLEGGGAKGVALAGAVAELHDAGYRFQRIAGTSVGALVGALLAAGMPVPELEATARRLDLARIAPLSRWSRFGRWGRKAAVLLERGVYDHAPMRRWLTRELARYGARTFGDLRIDDPDGGLADGRNYRLVVTAVDITRGRPIRLPWDLADYGLDPDEFPIADAVAASAALPLAFEPVRLRTADGEEAVLVDGGLLSRFPIDVFDRTDDQPARWPTVGIKLSAVPDDAGFVVRHRVTGPLSYLRALLGTAVASWDVRHLDDPAVVSRTVFVDTSDVSTLDFSLPQHVRDDLVDRGRTAAASWLAEAAVRSSDLEADPEGRGHPAVRPSRPIGR
jgi:NTE family protein